MNPWSERARASKWLPNLGFGGTLTAAFLTSFFAAQVGDAVLVILLFGPHAFLVEGLRVQNWKHGILSTGQPLSGWGKFLIGPLTLLFWIVFLFCTEWIAGLLLAFHERSAPWVSAALRIVGGLGLLTFSFSLYARWGFTLHPIPVSALISGLVLLYRGLIARSQVLEAP